MNYKAEVLKPFPNAKAVTHKRKNGVYIHSKDGNKHRFSHVCTDESLAYHDFYNIHILNIV